MMMRADEEFKNKSVIVTGVGSGIGRAVAIEFAKQGARVLVAELNEKTAAAVVDEIRAFGGTATAVTGDLSDQSVVERVVNTAITDSMSANDEVRVEDCEEVVLARHKPFPSTASSA